MALTNNEIDKINALYQQLDVMTQKYNTALEDIHSLTNKITEYADALVQKCECKCECHSSKKTTRKTK
jgi:DNA repair ATPase RecN